MLLTLLYGGLHLTWYWGTPLGRAAVLDERENLQLAHELATGSLPAEPFYRAMGYPLLLAGLDRAGLLPESAPQAATALGLLLHVLNTALAVKLAQRWFHSTRAGVLTGLLFGLNPVFIHHATQVLDNTLAGTLVLAGLQFLSAEPDTRTGRPHVLGLSLCWSAASLVRPQLLLLWLSFPAVWLISTGTRGGGWRQITRLAPALIAGTALWLAQGIWAWRVGGEFRFLPWHGPYNLWAANHPDANGRYYVQSRPVAPRAAGPTESYENPARIESIQLYREATGDHGPLRIDAMNDYWSRRLQREIAGQPMPWLALEFRKTVWLLSHAEQYNNKTYSFHRARSPWLRHNPLGWAPLLLFGSIGFASLAFAHRPIATALGLVMASLALGALAAYVSARFRLPLAMLLAVLAGGAVHVPRLWKISDTRQRLTRFGLPVTLAVLAYANLFGAADTSTFLQDHLLVAGAAERVDEDALTWAEARAALALRPNHPDALRLAITSYFNLLLTQSSRLPPEYEWLQATRALAAQTNNPAHLQQGNLVGLALWRSGDARGLQLWRSRLAELDDLSALAALTLAGAASPAEMDRLLAAPLADDADVFTLLAAARYRPVQLREWTHGRHDQTWLLALQQAADRIFQKGRGATPPGR
ncbi:MAG: hypothetical protein HYV95_04285 [Opitutae bacterium]|nr:hypothetical protein [Opitutae bacterium]